MNPPVAMTVAGSDSGAGAGIQVDLKTFAALRVFGVSAVTAVTVQNTFEVRSVHPVPPASVAAQVECLLDDFTVSAAKTGMLVSSQTVEAVSEVLTRRPLPYLVVDPVMVSSTGTRLLDDSAVATYLEHLLPLATLVTPNMAEASVITGDAVLSVDDMEEACRRISAMGALNVLVKGGHLSSYGSRPAEAVDVFYDGCEITRLAAPWVDSSNVHGTGCTLSASIVALLARGYDLPTALRHAKSYVHQAILGGAGWTLGRGHGPLDHFGWVAPSAPVASDDDRRRAQQA